MTTNSIEKILRIIDDHHSFVLTCHTNPDGDALGSTLGLRQILINMNKTATVITPDLPPTFYSWMPGIKTIKVYERDQATCDEIIDNAEVVVMMDYNDLKRIKSLGDKIISANKTTILIDHHTMPLAHADAEYSVPDASATCELVFNIFRNEPYRKFIDLDAAQNIYTGIITDTGGLSYNSSNPELYLTVAELLRMGINKPYVHDRIFNNKNMRRLRLLGYCLSKKMQRIEKLPLAIIALNAEELEKYNYKTGDTEGFVSFPLQIKDITATALILERPDAIKISLRSKEDFPVNAFAAQFYEGGGHLNAAGASAHGNFDEVVEKYKKNIVEFYTKWIKSTAK